MISADTAAWQKTAALLKQADKKVAAAMRKGLRNAAQPLADKVAQEGAGKMPHKGGLSAYLAANAKPTISLTGKDIMIKLQDKRGGVAIKAMDAGKLRHPVFGLRSTWVLQSVPEKAWTNAFLAHKDEAVTAVQTAVQKALDNLEAAPE